MNTAQELFGQINALYEDFKENHDLHADKGTKAAAQRARKAIGEVKKLITEYRKASVAECK
jgi:hypothetical protein